MSDIGANNSSPIHDASYYDYFNETVLLPDLKCRSSNNIGTLFIWAKHEEQSRLFNKEKFYNVLLGKPTHPLFSSIKKIAVEYWNTLGEEAIAYGAPNGECKYRSIAADALNVWYGNNIFNSDDIIFTVGGSTGLHAIFYAIDKIAHGKKIITPKPFYPMYTGYKGDDFRNKLHFIELEQSGYKLTAEALIQALKHIHTSEIGAFLFCDPNNPTGFSVGAKEWKAIASILRDYSNIPIILDEAYVEMTYVHKDEAFLNVAPELKDRVVLLRSATKGLSAAGERFALVATKNKVIYQKIIDFTMALYIHPPISLQHIYSHALQEFKKEDAAELSEFYHKRTQYVYNLLRNNHLHLSDQPHGSFYVLINLKKYLNSDLHPKAAQILGKSKIENDVDIAYHLLFSKEIALAPLSFFGQDRHDGILRITCSEEINDLDIIIQRLVSD